VAENIEADSLLAMTARWTAAVRAQESAWADRLFDDPWANALAGEVGVAWVEARSAESVLPIAIRTLPVLPVNMPDMPHNWFVVARKERAADLADSAICCRKKSKGIRMNITLTVWTVPVLRLNTAVEGDTRWCEPRRGQNQWHIECPRTWLVCFRERQDWRHIAGNKDQMVGR
jgi:hypothetical protein